MRIERNFSGNANEWRFGIVTVRRWDGTENFWIPNSTHLKETIPVLHERLTSIAPRYRFPIAVIDIDGDGGASIEHVQDGGSITEALLMLHRKSQAALAEFAREVKRPRSKFRDVEYIVGISRLAISGLERYGWQTFEFDSPSFISSSHEVARRTYQHAGFDDNTARLKTGELAARLAVMSRDDLLLRYGSVTSMLPA